jgi:Xaa-Pro aminopeptidase
VNRLELVRDRLTVEQLDALIVSDLTNIRWLTGFSGSAAIIVIDAGCLRLVTDGRYGEQATRQMRASGVDGEVIVAATAQEQLAVLAAMVSEATRVGFEAVHVSVHQHHRWVSEFAPELVPVVGVVEQGRRTKSEDEVSLIARAAAIADVALAEVVGQIQPGVTEGHVRDLLESAMRRHGADGPSYETIVSTGPLHAPLPHHRPTDTPIEAGHSLIIDVGALLGGYHSDMTRTFLVGECSDELHHRYAVVAASQAAGLAAVRPGVRAADVDAACRQVFSEAGLLDDFIHGTGHGVGLLIHEDPFLNRSSTEILQVGDVVTVEPGLYRGGLGGIRIEDLVVVTSDGCRVLTSSPKDQPCLPSPPTT